MCEDFKVLTHALVHETFHVNFKVLQNFTVISKNSSVANFGK